MAAAQLAQNLPQAERRDTAHLIPAATEACTRQAAQYGSVYVVDVEQRRDGRLIVRGSVTDAQQQRRTFECHFTTTVAGFRLREIDAR